jgi:DNA-binding transcriptional MerR regulator
VRISELSRESGVPVASIKYFKREGLLPEGRATAVTMVEYGPDHVKRLRLIKALTAVGGLSIAATREVLAAIDEAPHPAQTLKAVSYAMSVPGGARTSAGNVEETEDGDARAEVADLIAAMGWDVDCDSPHLKGLAATLREMERMGVGLAPATLESYARVAAAAARLDIERAATDGDQMALAEQAAISLALSGPLLELLRRVAQEDRVRRWDGAQQTATASAQFEDSGH